MNYNFFNLTELFFVYKIIFFAVLRDRRNYLTNANTSDHLQMHVENIIKLLLLFFLVCSLWIITYKQDISLFKNVKLGMLLHSNKYIPS